MSWAYAPGRIYTLLRNGPLPPAAVSVDGVASGGALRDTWALFALFCALDNLAFGCGFSFAAALALVFAMRFNINLACTVVLLPLLDPAIDSCSSGAAFAAITAGAVCCRARSDTGVGSGAVLAGAFGIGVGTGAVRAED